MICDLELSSDILDKMPQATNGKRHYLCLSEYQKETKKKTYRMEENICKLYI